jgi:hypothetical protein
MVIRVRQVVAIAFVVLSLATAVMAKEIRVLEFRSSPEWKEFYGSWAASNFEKDHPGVKVVHEFLSFGAAREKLLVSVAAVSMELVKFDTQAMQDPEISGVEYQQGELAGYEVREYLLEKWGRKCAYCDTVDVPLQVEHIVPKVRGGSNRVSNLTLACEPCNLAKGAKTAAEFGYPLVQQQAKKPLKDATAVNITRWALWRRLKEQGIPLETGTGGLTKYNRTRQGYPKKHWVDAACIGKTGESVEAIATMIPLTIEAKGRGSRQMCNMDRFGFPRAKAKAKAKRIKGFQTGDMVKACVTKGKNKGFYVGRVLVRATGSFDIKTSTKRVGGVSHRFCTLIQYADGYSYT